MTATEILNRIVANSGKASTYYADQPRISSMRVDPNWNDEAKARAIESGAFGPEILDYWKRAQSGGLEKGGYGESGTYEDGRKWWENEIPGMSISGQPGTWLAEMLARPNPEDARSFVTGANADPNAQRVGDSGGGWLGQFLDRNGEQLVKGGLTAIATAGAGSAFGGADMVTGGGDIWGGLEGGGALSGNAAAGGTGALTGGAAASGGGMSAFDAALENLMLSEGSGGALTTAGGELTANGFVGASGSAAFDQAMESIVLADGSGGALTTSGGQLVSNTVLTQILEKAKSLGLNPANVKTTLQKLVNGDPSGLKDLAKLGIPAAMIAGLFEKNKSPLLPHLENAAIGALGQADKYAALPSIGQTESEKRAIALSNSNVGNYQPYIDKAGALADTAAGGVTDEQRQRYENPYIKGVLDNTIRDIEESAGRRRQSLKATTSMSGNDIGAYGGSPSRFNVEDSLLDRETLKTVGDASAKLRMGAFDSAMGYAGKDLDRSLTASNLYGGMGKTVGALGATDVESLKTAGALERRPMEDERQKVASAANLYANAVRGTATAIPPTTPDSILGKASGALATLKGAKEVGLYGP